MTVGQVAQGFRLGSRPAARSSSWQSEALQGYAFLLPALVLLLLFHLLPVFYALFLSLFDARVFRDLWRPGTFAGAGNYGRLLSSSDFGQSLVNTVWFAGITVPIGLCLAVLFAQLLNGRKIGRA